MTYFLIAIGVFVYFIPTFLSLYFFVVDKNIDKSEPWRVFVLNFFFGWTIFGWFLAWIWAILGTIEGSGE